MRRILGTLAAVATAALFTGSGARADILVSTAGPMTGDYASFGEQLRRGAEMAVADINAAGGVLGQQLVLSIGDDACDPKQATAVANESVSKGVVFVAGHFCSSSSIPASAVYAEGNVLQITPSSTNPALTDAAAASGWTHVFRTCGRDDAQGLVAGKLMAEKYAGKAVAIIHDKSTYGKGIADETKKAMNANGLQEAMYEAINQGDLDYSALISKMKAANIEAIYAGLYHTEAGLLIRQAREQGLMAQLISEDALVTSEFWAIAGEAAEGTIMTFAPDPRKLESGKDIVARFTAEGYDPEGYTLYTYAAFQVWAAAVNAVGTVDAVAVSAAIRGKSYDTVLGSLAYDDKGDVSNSQYVWYLWSKGEYAETPMM
ncbi:MAG: branched-chain amino acid ABC transporter substrate-binding protein [Alphaproteobacteria bacterium]|nr:branched-chain amino acid ABC transporter substrate-binding protein [Alphaproteobacteria bacterium]